MLAESVQLFSELTHKLTVFGRYAMKTRKAVMIAEISVGLKTEERRKPSVRARSGRTGAKVQTGNLAPEARSATARKPLPCDGDEYGYGYG